MCWRLWLVLALPLACHVQAATRLSFLPSIFPSASGVTKPQRANPKASKPISKKQPTAKANEQLALPELLFDLKCSEADASAHGPRSCLGVGPNRACNRSLETDQGGAMDHRTGSGGPTGCSEAFLTVMGDDGFLPGVLLLLHTVRKYAQVDRDFIVLVSTQVTDDVIERLLSECVRVVQLDPFFENDLARQLVAKSERYKSGYWVIKMFVWRFEEYSKLVFLDGDIYFRQSADELFCAPVSPERPIAVTPRSSQDLSAGFNAGMFIFQPSRDMYMQIMEKFLSMKEEDMFATTEQDFLNQHFKARYNLIPIDYLMKHRRMVREKGLWPLQRVHGYHMNGNPKPWSPLWRAACAYPSAHRKDTAKYEDFYTEWWKYYHDFAQLPMPAKHEEYRLQARDDPTGRWSSLTATACP